MNSLRPKFARCDLNILHVVEARPNFMKVAPVMTALSNYPAIKQVLVHTGQHYDVNMSEIFFRKICFVGNVIIDTLVRLLPRTEAVAQTDMPDRYALVTLHRPSNVDEPDMLREIIDTLKRVNEHLPILFPVHPRTRKRIKDNDITIPTNGTFKLLDPVGYIEFLALQRNATVVITDSGGIQEETTCLGVPCLTVRENTERPITISMGINILVGQNMQLLESEIHNILNGRINSQQIPPLWDGKAGERIADILTRYA